MLSRSPCRPGFQKQTFCAAALLLSCLFASSSHASLNGSSVTVQLLSPNGVLGDPTPVNFSDTVVVVPGIEISAGDGSNVGSFMLTGVGVQESIDLHGSSIDLRLLSGATVGTSAVTGYEVGARYVFSGLFFPGSTIVGASLTGTGISNLSQAWVTLDNASQISFALDQIDFLVPASGTTYGDVTITINTALLPPIPEPGTSALLLAGLTVGGLWHTGRRRSRRG